jgi:hypothetical protein
VTPTEPNPTPATVLICEHIKPSGKRCGSPALSGQTLCFYHVRQNESLPNDRNMYQGYNEKAKPGEWPILNFPTPALEDAAAIQIGFMQALHGICNGGLDPRRAKLVLSALHGARMNLQQLEKCWAACLRGAVVKGKRKPPVGVKDVVVEPSVKAHAKR